MKLRFIYYKIKGILVFNATFNNIAVILVEETVVSRKKHIGLLQVHVTGKLHVHIKSLLNIPLPQTGFKLTNLN